MYIGYTIFFINFDKFENEHDLKIKKNSMFDKDVLLT